MIYEIDSSVRKKRVETVIAALSQVMKEIRKDRGLSQRELARRTGMHRTYLRDLERGIRNPSLSIVYLLATALEVRISDLMARAELYAERISL